MTTRLMAIDYGDTRTGVAFSDLLGMMAGETLVLRESAPEPLVRRLCELARQRTVSAIVVGLPRNMRGDEGPRADKTRAFAAMLETASGLPLTLWDERLTTVSAQRLLHDAGRHGRANRSRVDAVAAALILESYLASCPVTDEKGGGV